jgi:hypothetical protein
MERELKRDIDAPIRHGRNRKGLLVVLKAGGPKRGKGAGS